MLSRSRWNYKKRTAGDPGDGIPRIPKNHGRVQKKTKTKGEGLNTHFAWLKGHHQSPEWEVGQSEDGFASE